MALHIQVGAFAMFGDEVVDARRHNAQRYRSELQHGTVERAEPRAAPTRVTRCIQNLRDRH